MSGATERSAEWIYRGIWRLLVECFRVPDGPPRLPDEVKGDLRVFHPSRRYLAYLKMYFWVGLVLVDAAILVAWIAIYLANPTLGWILALPALAVAILPDIVAYIMIHLRYDTIWYGISDRGVYIRRGIMVIVEHTITHENIQNVSLRRGPVEQFCGISTLVVETAGASAPDGEDAFLVGNKAIMVGLADADEIRSLLTARVRDSRTAGLGDEIDDRSSASLGFEDVTVLREILSEVKQL